MDNKEHVVVHTIGKVASSSIVSAIKRSTRNAEIFHTHYLSEHKLEQMVTFFNKHGKTNIKHIEDSCRVRSLMKQRVPMKVVSLIRDPISREISAFFENLQYYGLDRDCLPSVKVAIEIFLQRYEAPSMEQWFDLEFGRVFGVDLLSMPFPKRVGWYSFEFCEYDFLLMKAELDDSIKGVTLGAFLKDRSISISRENNTAKKVDEIYYRDFIFNIKGKLVEKSNYYESAIAKLFYTEDELNYFKSKWLD